MVVIAVIFVPRGVIGKNSKISDCLVIINSNDSSSIEESLDLDSSDLQELDSILKECKILRSVQLTAPDKYKAALKIICTAEKDDSYKEYDIYYINNNTVKDKYPIPVIEELLDELGAIRFFSKLDLRSEYHQILLIDEYYVIP